MEIVHEETDGDNESVHEEDEDVHQTFKREYTFLLYIEKHALDNPVVSKIFPTPNHQKIAHIRYSGSLSL